MYYQRCLAVYYFLVNTNNKIYFCVVDFGWTDFCGKVDVFMVIIEPLEKDISNISSRYLLGLSDVIGITTSFFILIIYVSTICPPIVEPSFCQ